MILDILFVFSFFCTYLHSSSLFQSQTEGLVVVQLLSHVQLFVTPWIAARQASLSFAVSWSLLKLMSTESVMSPTYLILHHPLLLLPSIFPRIRVFSNESAFCIWCPKYWMGLLLSVSLPRSCGQMSKSSRPCALEFQPHAHCVWGTSWCGNQGRHRTCNGDESQPWDADKSLSHTTTSRWRAGMEESYPTRIGTKEPIWPWHNSELSLWWGLGYLKLSLHKQYLLNLQGLKTFLEAYFSVDYISLFLSRIRLDCFISLKVKGSKQLGWSQTQPDITSSSFLCSSLGRTQSQRTPSLLTQWISVPCGRWVQLQRGHVFAHWGREDPQGMGERWTGSSSAPCVDMKKTSMSLYLSFTFHLCRFSK